MDMDMLPVVGVGGGGEESDSESGFSAECLARMAEAAGFLEIRPFYAPCGIALETTQTGTTVL
jgi:hypothetical protein